jgi:hypothetical protein
MRDRIARLLPDAKVQGFTVQRMARRPRAIELIVGASCDPVFGPVLLFGEGGTAVEVIHVDHCPPALMRNTSDVWFYSGDDEDPMSSAPLARRTRRVDFRRRWVPSGAEPARHRETGDSAWPISPTGSLAASSPS